jgi:TPR repeat protein
VQRNYTIARDWFTRAADKGIAQAQYNLGIFYENGNGVQPDIEQAREWYQRAAAQGLNEAITKLEGLGASPREPDPLHEMIDTERENDIPQQAEPVGTEIASAKAGPSYDEDTEPSPTGIKREKWILDQPPDHYTIQIGSITSEEDLVNFLKRHNIENDSAYIQIVIDGVTRYNAFYGLFSNYQEAEQAISGLPGEIQRASPWIRNIRILQRLIN